MFFDEDSFEKKREKIAIMKMPEKEKIKTEPKPKKELSPEEIEHIRKIHNEINKKWIEANPEKYKASIKKGQKKYRKKNRRKMAEIERRYYYKHREEILARAKEKRRKLKEMEGK